MRRHASPAALAALALAFSGCVSSPPPSPVSLAAPALPDECEAFRFHPVALWLDSRVVRQGDTVPVKAGSMLGLSRGITTPDPMPVTCLTDWRISPAGAARLSADGSSLIVAPDAPAGATLTLEARTPGEPASYATPIIGRDEVVLTGTRMQTDVDCGEAEPPARPIRELVFGPSGRFSVTWEPFETYKDYWGDYAYDPATGRLALTITGGNRHPGANARLEGQVEVQQGGRRLVLHGFSLGGVFNGGAPCRYVFG